MSKVLLELRSLWKRDNTKFKKNVRFLSIALIICGAISLVLLALISVMRARFPTLTFDNQFAVDSASSNSQAAVITIGIAACVMEIVTGIMGVKRSDKADRISGVIVPSALAMSMWTIYAFGVYVILYDTPVIKLWSIPLMLTGFAAAVAYFFYLFRNRGMIPTKILYESRDPWGRERF